MGRWWNINYRQRCKILQS